MAKAAVGAARIEMSINSATFAQQMEVARKATSRYKLSLKNVSRQFDRTGKKWQSAGKSLMQNITAPMVGAVTGLVALQKATGNYAGELLDMANTTGMTTKALQEYKFALGEAGIGVDMMQRLMERNNQRMGRAAEGNKKFSEAYETLGVSLKTASGEMRSSEAVFDDVLKGLAGIEDGATRAAVAGDLLGTNSGRKLAGALSGGIEAMDEARAKAHELGLVLDHDALEAADKFATKLDHLQKQITASGQRLAVDLLPMVQDHLIPLFEKAMEKVGQLSGWFTKLDSEAQKRILKIVGVVGLLPPAIFAVGTAFIGISATISALLSPITLVIAAVAGLAAAVVYVADNWDAIKERISDVGWWRNMVINMVQFINDQFFRRIFDGFNAIFKYIGGTTLANPFDAVSKGLEALKTETKEYKTEFGSFTDAVLNGFKKISGFDLSTMFGKAAKTIDEKFGKSIGRREYTIDMKVNPPDNAKLVSVSRTIGEIIEGWSSKWDQFKKNFKEIGGDLQSFLAGEMSSAVLSFGDSIGRSLSGAENSWKTTFEKIILVVLDFAASLAKLAAAIGGVMLFIPGMQGAGIGLLAAATALQAASSGVKAGIEKRAGNREKRANETRVNDALIRSDGSVVRFHPDDDLLAMKDFSDLGKQFAQAPQPQAAGNNRTQIIENVINIDGKVFYRNQKKVGKKYDR